MYLWRIGSLLQIIKPKSRWDLDGDSNMGPSVNIPNTPQLQQLTGDSIVELNVGIICGCMPYLSPVFRQLHERLHHSALLKPLGSWIKSAFTRSNISDTDPLPEKSAFGQLETQFPEIIHLDTRAARGAGRSLNSSCDLQYNWLQGLYGPPDPTLTTRREAYE